jgi:DNA-binding response OmpR family regulator
VDIFVIEDDPDIADFVVDLLRVEGYRVLTHPDGDHLDEVIAAPPRLFLLDLMLPGKSGAEICRHLRATSSTANVPICMMTAAAPPMIEELGRACAYDALLRKPFDIDELLAVAAHFVRDGARHHEPPALPSVVEMTDPVE